MLGEAISFYYSCVPLAGVLHRTLKAIEVNVHQPEALIVAAGPLEVIDQRPGEIAAYVRAARDGFVHRAEVAVQVGGAAGVGNRFR